MNDNYGTEQHWLSYTTGSAEEDREIIISDSSNFILFGSETPLGKIFLTVGKWNYMCHTFNFSTRTKRVFYNGVQIGQGSTPADRELNLRGTLMLGNGHYISDGRVHTDESSSFGGGLFDTNFFRTELPAHQIKEMYDAGICSDFANQKLGHKIVLSWWDILDQWSKGPVYPNKLTAC